MSSKPIVRFDRAKFLDYFKGDLVVRDRDSAIKAHDLEGAEQAITDYCQDKVDIVLTIDGLPFSTFVRSPEGHTEVKLDQEARDVYSKET